MQELFEAHPTLKILLIVLAILAATVLLARLLRFLLTKLLKKLGKRDTQYNGRVSHKMLVKFVVAVVYVLGIITAVNQIPQFRLKSVKKLQKPLITLQTFL